ncbi:PPCDC [Blepharisma stoltei]|uniref:Flavoprotein domain-containing protein n=1 Tax=Blepharisma stoltei TaxID=1481888 RepID=A0AAU9JDT9_9CILI|nr:unnamed protein product [Blepharisma stoltei]
MEEDLKNSSETKKNILIGATGSVAAVRTIPIARGFIEAGYNVKIAVTESAKNFISEESPICEVYDEQSHWSQWKNNHQVLHINLRKWADILLIAPLDANTLAKMANGLCDNLLTCVVRAWDLSKPMVLAPAMNTMMWENPFTNEHLNKVREVYNAHIVGPIAKTLACQETGIGAISDTQEIIRCCISLLSNNYIIQ